MPSWSSLNPNSNAEQIIPWDTTPLILAGLSASCLPEWLLYRTAPTFAKQIFWPAATLGAPQTTSISSLPVDTRQSDNRSACG